MQERKSNYLKLLLIIIIILFLVLLPIARSEGFGYNIISKLTNYTYGWIEGFGYGDNGYGWDEGFGYNNMENKNK